MKISKWYNTPLRVFSVCFIMGVLIIGSAKTAIAQVYFYDYTDSLSQRHFKKGYIVTLHGDTLKGEIRKTGRCMDFFFGESRTINKITFAQDKNKKHQKEYKPGEIKGFGIVSSYVSQRPVDLTPEYTKSGWIKSSTLKRLFTDPFNWNTIEQFNANLTYDRMAHFESIKVDSTNIISFYQRLAEGKLTVFCDPSSWNYYYNKLDSLNQTDINQVNSVSYWEYKKLFNSLFDECEEALKLAR